MSNYTREQIIQGRKCGLKFFDEAVAKVGIDKILQRAIELQNEFPRTWKPGWSNMSWALGNAVREFAVRNFDYPMSWNIDEALTPEQMQYLRDNTFGEQYDYEPTWPRKQIAVKKSSNKRNPAILTKDTISIGQMVKNHKPIVAFIPDGQKSDYCDLDPGETLKLLDKPKKMTLKNALVGGVVGTFVKVEINGTEAFIGLSDITRNCRLIALGTDS